MVLVRMPTISFFFNKGIHGFCALKPYFFLRNQKEQQRKCLRTEAGQAEQEHICFHTYFIVVSITSKLLCLSSSRDIYSRLKVDQQLSQAINNSVHIWEGFALVTNKIQLAKATNDMRDKVAFCGN